MTFKDLKISTQLTLAFGLLVLVTALVGGINVFNAWNMQNNLRDSIERRMLILHTLSELRDAHNLQGASLRNALMTTSPDVVNEQFDLISDARTQITRHFEVLDPLLNQEESRAIFERMLESHKNYDHQMSRMMAVMREGSTDDDPSMMLDVEVRPHQESYFIGVKALSELENKLSNEASQATLKASQGIIYIASSAVLIIVVCAIVMGVVVIRGVTRPIRTAVAMARSVANGDLTVRIQSTGRNETGQLLQSLVEMQEGLLKVVRTVRTGSDALATSSAEIARGNQDLSSRTESQASALQETAASMSVLGQTVQMNADNASQANQLAQSASHVAAQGGEVVSEVVSTMRGITEASKRIGEITSVIDSIAFQTNILALNAAVEAARAGEQGRGFAVVASEVRNLAHRSAEAAKEIKNLIQDSVDRIETGSALVDRAGSTMHDVVISIQRVTDIVGEITAASQEQSNGVQQVSQAVSLMDQSTQQNAALVEEMAASASSLNVQAQELVQAVSTFRTEGVSQLQSQKATKAKPQRKKRFGRRHEPALQAS